MFLGSVRELGIRLDNVEVYVRVLTASWRAV